MEDYKSLGSPTSPGPCRHYTIYLNRDPCDDCRKFVSAIEKITTLQFTFNAMTRVMTREQHLADIQRKESILGNGGENVVLGHTTNDNTVAAADKQSPPQPSQPKKTNRRKTTDLSSAIED